MNAAGFEYEHEVELDGVETDQRAAPDGVLDQCPTDAARRTVEATRYPALAMWAALPTKFGFR